MNKKNAALVSVFSNTALIILKIIAGILMGSIAVISEAVHSAIDLIASVVAYFSIKKAIEPADSDHPFGHGKYENISGFFEAMLIFFAAAFIVYEAVKKFFAPSEVQSLDWGIGVMIFSVFVNIAVSRILFKVSKKTNSIALEADAMHLSVDVFTSVSVIVGLVVIKFTGWKIVDPIIAIVVACMICKASLDLTKKSIGDLADQSLPENELQIICRILESNSDIKGYHKMRTRKSGDQREIEIHITMEKDTTLERAHDFCFGIENKIREAQPGSHITLHVEPYHGNA
ncbi:MAG TPA: cation transporter [Fibrobacteres bacterium]|nr:cation transporter [Fibrobacterota bacterium]